MLLQARVVSIALQKDAVLSSGPGECQGREAKGLEGVGVVPPDLSPSPHPSEIIT